MSIHHQSTGSPASSQAGTRRWASSVVQYLIPGLLACYLTASLFLWTWVVLDVATGSFRVLESFELTLPQDEAFRGMVRLAVVAAAGGAIGGLLLNMRSLWFFTTRRQFDPVYIGDYVFRQFGSAALACVILILVRSGILTLLGVSPSSGTDTAISGFSAFGIGFLAGFGSYRVTDRLGEIVAQTFTSTRDPEGDARSAGSVEKED